DGSREQIDLTALILFSLLTGAGLALGMLGWLLGLVGSGCPSWVKRPTAHAGTEDEIEHQNHDGSSCDATASATGKRDR
ncbi:MAG TPA: hypothetical protein PLO27_04620, partial [Marmoricola sp.]|nr:hypothetical protein [Marmoricola sp.]